VTNIHKNWVTVRLTYEHVRAYDLDEAARRHVRSTLVSLGDQNPYNRSQYPLFSEYRGIERHLTHMAEVKAERAKRRQTETVYRVGRDADQYSSTKGRQAGRSTVTRRALLRLSNGWSR
jgi:hypothetical protein